MYNILVAEDEKDIAAAIEIYLKTQNYNVFKAYDGEEAIKLFEREEIQLILMDIMMPKMDGIKATMKIRENSNVPIIFLSAKSEDTDKIMGLNIGADDYITKPFNPMELLARVNSCLRRYTNYSNYNDSVNEEDLIKIGGIELNDKNKEITVDGEPIKTTPLEYKILYFFMKNPNQVFSIEEIYEKVWREPAYNPDTVTVHIRRIREKIEINPREPKYLRKKILILLGVNLLVLIIISLVFPFGWILAVGYTIFLYNYLIKTLEKMRFLNEASSILSKGNFDISLPEDMGILSPFSKNLNNIKDGFKIAIDKEVKSQSMKTELITNVSHDLKTPLTSIITYIDLLKADGVKPEVQKEYLDVLDKKSKRLKTLIDDLFDISRATSGNIELYLEKLDVIALLRQTLGELEERIVKSNLQFKINLPESKVICQLDGRKTYRVFENIISNILKYSMQNSRVYIDTSEDDKNISIVFKNIAAYEMNFNSTDIMDRFIRGDASRSTDGSGLGLAIAKSLIELQGGSLDIIVDGDLFKLLAIFPKTGE